MPQVNGNLVRKAGRALPKAINPVLQAVSMMDTVKSSSQHSIARQNAADQTMGVNGNFKKFAAYGDADDERYKKLYVKQKKPMSDKQKALIASGATLGALALYGGVKHSDPLWAGKALFRNKGVAGSKAFHAMVKNTPLKDVAKYVGAGVNDGFKAPPFKDDKLNVEDHLDKAIKGGGGLGDVFLLGITAGVGKDIGQKAMSSLREKMLRKKLAQEAEERAKLNAYSKDISAEDLFKKASTSTGDDIATAVNKSVEKFLPDEIRKRAQRTNRYNSYVDYVDQGAHGGDAPQRRLK